MRIVPHDEHLRDYLKLGGVREHVSVAEFEFDAVEFDKKLVEVRQQHPNLSEEKQRARAAYRMLTQQSAAASPSVQAFPPVSGVADFWERKRVWVIAWAIAILVLLGAQLAHCQTQGVTTLGRYLTGQPGGIIIQLQNQGSVLATRPAGLLVFNCSTNMSCSFSGSTFTITSSATAGTAWSSLTAPTANLSMSHGANTTTFTWGAATGVGVNLFTLTDTLNNTGTGILNRIFTASGSGLTPFQADSNGNGWLVDTTGLFKRIGTASMAVPGTARGVVLSQGAAAAITTTTAGTTGQVLLSNGAGTDPSFGDPVVSGTTALASDTLTAAGTSTAVSLSGGGGGVMRLTFGGTVTALDVRGQVSIDGGTNFQDVDTYNISSEVVQLSISSATAADYSLYVPAGATHVRANVVTLTGTTPSITIAMRTSYVANPRTHTAFDRVPGSSDPGHVIALGASDGTNLQRLRTATAAPTGTEQGLITRNIPSGTQPVSGTVTANAGTGNFAENVTQWNGVALGSPSAYGTSPGAVNVPGVNAFVTNTPTVTANAGTGTFSADVTDRAARLVGQVEGRAASGTAKAGNPDQIGYVFNTTQPTVTTGQAVEAQGTARGALIVATGVDALTITPSGTQTVSGTVTANQGTAAGASSKWPIELVDSGGVNIATVKAASTAIAATDLPLAIGLHPSSPLPAGTNAIGTVTANQGTPTNWAVNQAQIGGSAVIADPCQQLSRSVALINLVAGGQIVTGVAAKQTYVCSLNIITATAQNIALVEGTGVVCATGTAGMAGGATAATGWNFAANGGMAFGNGANWLFKTATAADNVCLLLSGTGQTSGSVTYVQQ